MDNKSPEDLYRSGNYPAARAGFESAAQSGDAKAMYMLGFMAESGKGQPADPASAAAHYRRAAEAGQHEAQHNLGMLYFKGEGVKQDDAEALRWLQQSAEAGDLESRFQIGWIYMKGRGVERDPSKAKRYWASAHERGHARSTFALGRAFLDGSFGEREADTGVGLLLSASQRGLTEAGEMLLATKDSIEAEARAGDADAQCAFGLIEMYGFMRNDTSFPWLEKAASQGNTRAMTTLAWCYVIGQGVPADDARALEYYRSAGRLGDIHECYDTGVTLLNGGRKLKPDPQRAISYFRCALDAGFRKATLGLAVAFARRDRDVRDVAAAIACAVAYVLEANDSELEIEPDSGRWSAVVSDGGRTIAISGIEPSDVPHFSEIASAAAAGKPLPVHAFVQAAEK